MNGTALCNDSSDSSSGTMFNRLIPSSGSKQPRVARQQQHFQQVGRLGRAADNVRLDRLAALLFENGRDRAKCLHDLARLRRERQMDRDQRPILRQLFASSNSKRSLGVSFR